MWQACLKGITSQQIKEGLGKLALSGENWPPSAPEFRSLCDGTAERKGQPTGSAAVSHRIMPPSRRIKKGTSEDGKKAYAEFRRKAKEDLA